MTAASCKKKTYANVPDNKRTDTRRRIYAQPIITSWRWWRWRWLKMQNIMMILNLIMMTTMVVVVIHILLLLLLKQPMPKTNRAHTHAHTHTHTYAEAHTWCLCFLKEDGTEGEINIFVFSIRTVLVAEFTLLTQYLKEMHLKSKIWVCFKKVAQHNS